MGAGFCGRKGGYKGRVRLDWIVRGGCGRGRWEGV